MLKIDGKTVINVKNDEEYNILKDSIIGTSYRICYNHNGYFYENTCYDIIHREYSDKKFYLKNGYKVISVDEFLETDIKLKVGDILKLKEKVRYSNGFYYNTKDYLIVNEICKYCIKFNTVSGSLNSSLVILDRKDYPDFITKVDILYNEQTTKEGTVNMNNLPMSWFVINNGTELFRNTVIKDLNNHYKSRYTGSDVNKGYYYGIIDSTPIFPILSDNPDKIKQFEGIPKLSLATYISLTRGDYGTNGTNGTNNKVINKSNNKHGESIKVPTIVGQISRGKRIIGVATKGKVCKTSITGRQISYRSISS